MRIGGLQKCSLIDYPGQIASVIFLSGCNFNCSFCHNPELIPTDSPFPLMSVEKVITFLKTRKKHLNGVVISGGEPTIQPALPLFLEDIKSIGFLIKLDTNGSKSEVLSMLLKRKLLDFIAMDIKAPLNKYTKLCGKQINPEIIKESIAIIEASGLPYLFRTTFVPELLTAEDITQIKKLLKKPENHLTQPYQPFKK